MPQEKVLLIIGSYQPVETGILRYNIFLIVNGLVTFIGKHAKNQNFILNGSVDVIAN